jgi:phosphohistidine phosphatase
MAGGPERTLVLLRHGKSDWSGGEPDHDRPLVGRGRRQAAEAGRWLAGHLDRLDLAVVSTAERARQTWAQASAELEITPPVRFEERAYAASGSALLGLVRELADDLGSVVLVGHNPGLEDLASTLSDEWVPLPTSALAVMTLAGRWVDARPGSVELATTGRPPP